MDEMDGMDRMDGVTERNTFAFRLRATGFKKGGL